MNTSKLMKCLAYFIVVLGVLNYLIFGVVGLMLGGDAVRGKVEGGKYFVGHGRSYTEVSKSTYEFSRLHTYTFWATHALMTVGGFYLVIKQNREKADSHQTNP